MNITEWDDLHDYVKPLISKDCPTDSIYWDQAVLITEKLNRLDELESDSKLRYKNEINDFFDYLREDWMDDYEHQQMISESLKEMNLTVKTLDDMIHEGVKNGYSVEYQMDIVKQVIKRARNE